MARQMSPKGDDMSLLTAYTKTTLRRYMDAEIGKSNPSYDISLLWLVVGNEDCQRDIRVASSR